MDEVEELIEKLLNGKDGEKMGAGRTLGEGKDPRSVEPLIKALGSSSDELTRYYVIEALKEIGDGRAAEPLVEVIKNTEDMRANAVNAVVGIGEPSVVPIIKALPEADLLLRKWLESALVRIGEPAVKYLVEALKKPEYAELRKEISKVISEIDKEAKKTERDFGIREKEVIPANKIPDEFKKAMLKDGPVRVKA